MGHMRFKDTEPYPLSFWKKNNIDLVFDKVTKVNATQQKLQLEKGGELHYDKLVIASGSSPNKLPLEGMELTGVQGLYSKQDLEEMEKNTQGIKHAVVVGGGLIGVEMAEMLLSRNISVDFVVRDANFWGSVLPKVDAEFVEKHMHHHKGLRLLCAEEITAIKGENGRVKSVLTRNSEEEISCDFVGVTIGVHPNISFLASSGIACDRGILVDEYLTTNFKNVFAIGDCAQQKQPVGERKAIEQVWYTGRIMGETLAQTLTGNATKYTPGNWFNSAKFFDLEYQTYGWVWPQLKENEASFAFTDKAEKVHLHFVYDTSTKALKGVNSFGLRLRHDVFDYWLNEKASINEVLKDFESAVFDPEFFQQYGRELIAKYNAEKQENIVLAPKKWWRKLING